MVLVRDGDSDGEGVIIRLFLELGFTLSIFYMLNYFFFIILRRWYFIIFILEINKVRFR